jgi:DAK2 domain fusion protein YloV
MAELGRLTDAQLRSVMICYRDLLGSHQQALNRLNVYPVPDADTGTNMTLTVEAVVSALGQATGMASTCRAISRGALLGGRGISGVVLAQLLGAAASRFAHSDSIDGSVLAQALTEASRAADRAVVEPVEGTILTVARAAARAATTAAGTRNLVGVLDAARAAAYDALVRTPELLAALRQAGVVDAGGAGFLLLLDALLQVAADRPPPEPPPGSPPATAALRPRESPDVRVPRYEVVLLLDSSEGRINELRAAWGRLGGSVVVVGGNGTWRCHVHTDDVDGVLEAARAQGRPRGVRVTDLVEQVRQQGGGAVPAGVPDSVRTAVVAAAAGPGIGGLFRSLGASRTVAAWPLRPSTGELLAAVEAAPAGEVVVLPNDRRIVPAAEQAAALSSKTVRVVPTSAAPEGLVALFGYDPGASVEDNAGTMAAQAARVRSGQVTQATRDATWKAGEIRVGNWLGITVEDGIQVVRPDLAEAALGLLEALVRDEDAIVVVIQGEGSSVEATGRIVTWLGQHRPRAAVELLEGGQPLFPYLFGVEPAEETPPAVDLATMADQTAEVNPSSHPTSSAWTTRSSPSDGGSPPTGRTSRSSSAESSGDRQSPSS